MYTLLKNYLFQFNYTKFYSVLTNTDFIYKKVVQINIKVYGKDYKFILNDESTFLN